MKKVISALTAAAMCASMSASAITVLAEYTAANTSFYLKVVDATAGTISEDGSKVTLQALLRLRMQSSRFRSSS